MTPGSNIHFLFNDVKISLSDRNKLKAFISNLFKKEGKKLEKLNYVFCTDKELLRINRDWLHHDFYTDIITFDLSEDAGTKSGEIYISADRVRENAGLFKTSIKKELLRVIFHGALHLCGYKDKTPKEKKLMRVKEDKYINLYL